jgi:hypothetical protein
VEAREDKDGQVESTVLLEQTTIDAYYQSFESEGDGADVEAGDGDPAEVEAEVEDLAQSSDDDDSW